MITTGPNINRDGGGGHHQSVGRPFCAGVQRSEGTGKLARRRRRRKGGREAGREEEEAGDPRQEERRMEIVYELGGKKKCLYEVLHGVLIKCSGINSKMGE